MATITKRPYGSYQVQIRLSGLSPITKTFKTKTLAKQFAREVEANVFHNRYFNHFKSNKNDMGKKW